MAGYSAVTPLLLVLPFPLRLSARHVRRMICMFATILSHSNFVYAEICIFSFFRTYLLLVPFRLFFCLCFFEKFFLSVPISHSLSCEPPVTNSFLKMTLYFQIRIMDFAFRGFWSRGHFGASCETLRPGHSYSSWAKRTCLI